MWRSTARLFSAANLIPHRQCTQGPWPTKSQVHSSSTRFSLYIMAPVRDFYQVGGFQRSGFNARYTSDELAQAIAGPHSPLRVNVKGESYVELVLGILPSGASYLLVTADQFHALTFRHHCLEPKPSQRPWSATDFMSLSPIVFHDVGELKQKIGTYKHKAGKNISGDTSQANKAYVSSGNDRTAGESRAAYEQQRLLYRTITKTVDPEKFSYPRPSVDMLRVLAITFTLQPAIFDGRKSFQRRSEPKVLDIGWAEAHLDSSQGLTFSDAEGVTGHARFKDNMIFGGPGKNAANIRTWNYCQLGSR
ncbi:hypothetical protein PLICRDRAFT_589201 [Plicaturopsis crispa FD-325 SS-3]|nr:hypothetical protein PLICRDRAFT_589201 [Plicaturopsis crispa FD-325 SS-3]